MIFLAFLTYIVFATNGYAIEITPQNLDLYNEKQTVTIYNNKPQAVEVKFKLEDFIMTDKASLKLVDTFAYSLKPHLKISNKNIKLNAGESKDITFTLDKSKFDGGDYHSHLTYIEKYSYKTSMPIEVSLPITYISNSGQAKVIIKNAYIKDKQLSVVFNKLNRKKNAKTWVEAYAFKPNEKKEVVTPFYNKIYREVGQVTRYIHLNYNLTTYDFVQINIWQSPKKIKLLDSYKLKLI